MAWLPSQAGHIKTLESVQRWFTRQIPGFGHLQHTERYHNCGLQTIEERRDRGVAIETFKILTDRSGVRKDIIRLQDHDHETRGRNKGNLQHEKPNKDLRKNTFATLAPIIWDSIDINTRNATSVNNFKNLYDQSHQRD